MLHWTNYTLRRMENFIKGIKDIYNALIQHGGIHPRNIMVIDGDPERVIWIDFNGAQTFDAFGLNEKVKNGWHLRISLLRS